MKPPQKQHAEWASVPHYLTHPGYMQNYLRAYIMSNQMYDCLTEKYGNFTENPKIAKIFSEKIFSKGKLLDDNSLMKRLTGKDISPKYLEKVLNMD